MIYLWCNTHKREDTGGCGFFGGTAHEARKESPSSRDCCQSLSKFVLKGWLE